ncbi:disulfide bond formation protein B [Ruegeria pomeroyi]|uniref:Disulfide bond formation protein B n=1 Tax=Ruegeria pomeroyi TaxID=89184 RepID=A0A9Q3ZMS5_9RHOB|nr:disulfide bond formation protein B [Ruegeria pomeroyi]MCE8538380.1 disulfide bond formation protein B [Ruegeria pomeroyi]
MTRNRLVLLAAGGSAALLLAAWGFQFLGGMAPCKLCIWQRYPHGAAVLIGAVTLATGWRILPWAGALAALTTAGIGLYHAGVEQGWWEGPTTCTSGPIGNLSAEQLMAQIMEAPLVRCDEIPWDLFGISMAGWNGLVSLGLALVWLLAATRRA